MTLDECASHVDERVTYRPVGGDPEEGVITRVGRFAFVLYDGDCYSKATDPADLTLLDGDR